MENQRCEYADGGRDLIISGGLSLRGHNEDSLRLDHVLSGYLNDG